MSVLGGNGFNIARTAPYNSDEIFWHLQTAASEKYTMPQGYFGYNGSHAAVGTYGAWGFFPFPPYVILCRLFGMKIYSRHIINLYMLGVALLLFSLLAELDEKKIVLLQLSYIFSPVTIRYSISAMNEGERYAFSILICGFLVSIYRKKRQKWYVYGLIPCFLIYAVLSYDIFIFFVPVYLMIILRGRTGIVRFGLNMLISFLVMALCRMINGITSAEYTLTGDPNVLKAFIGFFEEGFILGIRKTLYMMYRNLARFGPLNLINIRDREYGMYSVYLGMIVIICIYILILGIYRFIRKQNMGSVCLAAWFIWGYVFAFGALYTDDEITLVRSLNCAMIVLVLILIIFNEKKKLFALILFSIFTIPISWRYVNDVYAESHVAYDNMAHIKDENEILSKIMEIRPNDRWANTIAWYGDISGACLEVPTGFGINYCIENIGDNNMGWLIINKTGGVNTVEIKDMLSGYGKEYENENLIVYKREGDKLCIPLQ
ncbi:MAG: hypothetical protein J6P45_03860 [Lachnospiraceae bacterium]|nr:hypothetical protein [Lachnospiraceae bacterium]